MKRIYNILSIQLSNSLHLAIRNEEKDGVRIERLITPNVSVEDIEEAAKQAGSSINLNGIYPISSKILRKISPILERRSAEEFG